MYFYNQGRWHVTMKRCSVRISARNRLILGESWTRGMPSNANCSEPINPPYPGQIGSETDTPTLFIISKRIQFCRIAGGLNLDCTYCAFNQSSSRSPWQPYNHRQRGDQPRGKREASVGRSKHICHSHNSYPGSCLAGDREMNIN